MELGVPTDRVNGSLVYRTHKLNNQTLNGVSYCVATRYPLVKCRLKIQQTIKKLIFDCDFNYACGHTGTELLHCVMDNFGQKQTVRGVIQIRNSEMLDKRRGRWKNCSLLMSLKYAS